MKRYIVEASYFVWADSDEGAKEIAERKMCSGADDKTITDVQ